MELKEKIKEEGDNLTWTYKKLNCSISRVSHTGCWCGYVELTTGHPWYDYNENFVDLESKVHGGISYLVHDMVGFDCNHFCDLSPIKHINPRDSFDEKVNPHLKDQPVTYKDMNFAIEQTEILAEEVINNVVRIC